MKRIFVAVLLVLIAAPAFCEETNSVFAAVDGRSSEQRLIQVIVTTQRHNPLFPWLKSPTRTHYGYGFAIGDGRVLTTEHLVRNHTLVELRRARTGLKVPATVEISDAQVDLALLSFEPSEGDRLPLFRDLSEHIGRREDLTILQFDETREIQQGTAKVLQINMTRLPAASYSSLSFKLLTNLNVDGEGVPVLAGNRLAGLMLSYDETERTGEMIPYPVITRFLDDALSPPYTGFATAGFILKPLVDPVKREYLKVDEPDTGILILACIPGTDAAESLMSQDVIISWDGYRIGSLGYYEDPEFGRLPVSYLIKGRLVPGSTVPVTVIRDGNRMEIDVTVNHLEDSASLIPENVEQEQEEYLVQGGLVIRELSGLYLRSRGPNWAKSVDPKLVHIYNTRRLNPSTPGEKVVILSQVLPHPINVGYQEFRDMIVQAVNGEPVHNMADVFRVVDEAGGLERLTLDSTGVDLVMDKLSLKYADSQLADNYRIPELRYRKAAARTGQLSE